MQVSTIVHAYVDAAAQRAVSERLDDGTFAATVPDCFGVIAFGATAEECATDLYARLEDWVRVGLAKSIPLPVLDGIDLNSVDGQALTAYHAGEADGVTGAVFKNEQEFVAALDRQGRQS